MSKPVLIRLSASAACSAAISSAPRQSPLQGVFSKNNHSSYFYHRQLGFSIGLVQVDDAKSSPITTALDEAFFVFDGQAHIGDSEDTQPLTFNKGQAFIIPAGTQAYLPKQGFSAFHVISAANALNSSKTLSPALISFEQQASSELKEVELSGAAFEMQSQKKANKGQHLYQSSAGHFIAGLWQSEAIETKPQAFPRNEFLYVHSGELICIDEASQQHVFTVGDAVFIPQGTLCHWLVQQSVCAYYVIIQ